ncbi:hypothetical protein [Zhongshania sp.]|uniref:hypothetical protein n=1 Tax=Zhongshania sp. TaxID=1971902 RepID=UPI002A81C287|nr:hypothetical protein [Zhongshania sp.]
MSISTLSVTMGRIAAATEASPIAVFCSDSGLLLNAFFADTLKTNTPAEVCSRQLIGIYHNRMPLDAVRNELSAWIGEREVMPSVANAS